MNETTRNQEYSTEAVLYLAFELGDESWKLSFSPGLGQPPRKRPMKARDMETLKQEVKLAKKRFGLPEETVVKSCYEAGRDGFWLHRCLLALGIENEVVDSASIEVSRRSKRVKTDGVDADKLLTMLIRYHQGEKGVWSVVHVPSVEAEDMRHMHRQLLSLKVDRTQRSNRIKSLLVTQGIKIGLRGDFEKALEELQLWDGSVLPPGVRARIEREYKAFCFIEQQIKELEAERREWIRTSQHSSVEQVRQLLRLCGIGENSAWLFVMEFFGWREFRNRREIGSLAGLTPTPYQSGDYFQEQGISKAGNRMIRAMVVEIAWAWLRHQPDSELSLWFEERFGRDSKRARKVGIVALARKLLVALWRYLETGEIPAGAHLKA
jgi:transposase